VRAGREERRRKAEHLVTEQHLAMAVAGLRSLAAAADRALAGNLETARPKTAPVGSGGGSRVSPVWPRNPLIMSGGWMRRSRLRAAAAS
jgi:hypothetical protein